MPLASFFVSITLSYREAIDVAIEEAAWPLALAQSKSPEAAK